MLDFWDSKPFLDAANILVGADEPLRALKLLELVPGYYRDNCPAELKSLREEILAALATPPFYQSEDRIVLPKTEDVMIDVEVLLRWKVIKNDVEQYNKMGIVPHIVDLGPGSYWLPIGLQGHKCLFTYQDISLNPISRPLIKEHLGDKYFDQIPKDRPVIFIACEIIEHLHHEEDICTEIYKLGYRPNIVHISTPKHTFDTRAERVNWKLYGTLGHLRTYTPAEFMLTVGRLFPGYKVTFYDHQILHARAELV